MILHDKVKWEELETTYTLDMVLKLNAVLDMKQYCEEQYYEEQKKT